jgi:hypothetical protein
VDRSLLELAGPASDWAKSGLAGPFSENRCFMQITEIILVNIALLVLKWVRFVFFGRQGLPLGLG